MYFRGGNAGQLSITDNVPFSPRKVVHCSDRKPGDILQDGEVLHVPMMSLGSPVGGAAVTSSAPVTDACELAYQSYINRLTNAWRGAC